MVAVTDPGSEPAGLTRLGERALHAVFAQRMRACPFGRLAVGAALHTRLRARSAG